MKRIATLLFVIAGAVFAQTGRGTLTGTITDSSGAVVPRASVLLTNAETKTRFEAQTSAAGVYTVPELPYGRYAVEIRQAGFQTAVASGVQIAVNQVTRFDATLQVGEVQQSVEVTAAAPLLQQDSSTVQTNYNTKLMSELPLALGAFSVRSPEAFTFLTPGVVGTAWLNTINGGQTWSNSVLLDGASAGRSWHPGDFDESAPSVEALGEFSIKTNAFSAEYGRTGSAITSFAYRSGTNDLHGSVYAFERNEAFNAKGFYHQNTFDRKHDNGFTTGGPIYLPKLYNGRDRTFFFFSFEKFLTNLQYDVSPLRVPTDRQKQGDFGELLTLRNPVQIHNPRDGTAYAGNLIPKSQWSKVSSYALQYFPSANMIEPGTGLQRFYYQPQPTDLWNNLQTLVLDHNITSAQRFHYSWSRRNNHRFRDPANLLPRDNPLTMFREQIYNTNQWRSSLDSVITSRLLNHLNIGIDRLRSYNATVTDGMDFVKNSGLKNVANTHTPAQNIGGYMGLSTTELNTHWETRYEIANNLTWVHGKHTFKFGGDIRRTRWNIPGLNNTAGTFTFNAMQTASRAGLGGDGFATYLLGAATSASKRDALLTPGWRMLYTAAFFQDDWKVTSRLTLNLGMRWEVDFPRVEVANRYSGLNPYLPNPAAGGIPGVLEFATKDHRHFDNTSWRGFGPRAGLAYALDRKTVIRTGYGIYYNLIYYDFGASMRAGFEAAPAFTSPDGKLPAFYWDDGFPDNYAKAPFFDPSAQNKQGIDYVAADGKPPYIQSWNFTIERQLTSSFKVEAAYVANKGTRLNRILAMMQTKPDSLQLGDLLTKRIDDPAVAAAGFRTPYPTFIQDWGAGATLWRALRPFPQYNSTNWINSTGGNSTYNSLQVKAEKRMSRGLQFMLAYTWSKSLTNTESSRRTADSGITPYQNSFMGINEKSVALSDRPHILATSFIYELPVGRGKPVALTGIAAKFLGGWQLTGTMRYVSGTPLNLEAACPSITLVNAGACRPSYTGVTPLYGPGWDDLDPNNGKPILNAEAFMVPRPYTFGNVSRNMGNLRTKPGMAENAGLLKHTRLTERVRMQFRAEAFNLFNRVQFAGPYTNVGAYDPNRPSQTSRNQNFGFFSGQANDPRVIQLALKLLF